MSTPRILHMFFPGKNVSPFDVNMAADSGFQIIVPYHGISAEQIPDLIQDAIFSRPPKMHQYTGAFFGGWDVNIATDMLTRAREAMMPPFAIGLFADPNGAYTTSAALVALIANKLAERGIDRFEGLRVKIFGGGPVGLCAAILIARQGGQTKLVRLTPPREDKQAAIAQFCDRYSIELGSEDGETTEQKHNALAGAQIAITTAKAGIQVLDRFALEKASQLMIAADVNAVPPTGIEGLAPTDDGISLDVGQQAIGLGALAIGAIKYRVQIGLFKQMMSADEPQVLDFQAAYDLARKLV